MGRPMGLSLQDDDTREPARRQGSGSVVALLAGFLALLLFGAGYLGYEVLRRTRALERQMAALATETRAGAVESREALKRAMQAEAAAHAAAQARQAAEVMTATAQEEAEAARHEASSAKDEAARAKAEAERVRKQAEAEMNRLDEALSQIADTQRTALGLVMKLGSDYLKFEFDKAELRTADRELLSRVAGILLTSQDYTVSVNGHTDDQGSPEYNQKLSERRAQAVRDYLVKAGLPAEIVSVSGHGKSLPVVPGTSEEARAKNRRVELAIANTRIRYGPAAR